MSETLRNPERPAETSIGAGVLLVNLGTPDAPTPRAVRRFLAEFLHDRRVVELTRWLWCPLLHFLILPLRGARSARAYASIWTSEGSPLKVYTERLTAAVAAQLPASHGESTQVRMAMRYGEPSVGTALRGLRDAGCTRILVLPLYPQYSATTTASVFDAVTNELSRWRDVPALHFVRDYAENARWVEAIAASIEAHWHAQGRGERLLLSFHGIPEAFDRAGDPYRSRCEASAAALRERLGIDAAFAPLTFQSRLGRAKWLAPYTEATLRQLAAEGVRRVDVACPGFAVDCLETLEEIAIGNRGLFIGAGGHELRCVPCLNATADHVAALTGLIESELGHDSPQRMFHDS